MAVTEIKIDKTTLPPDGLLVEFQTHKMWNNEQWAIGSFIAGDDLFWINSSIFYNSNEVLYWRCVNCKGDLHVPNPDRSSIITSFVEKCNHCKTA